MDLTSQLSNVASRAPKPVGPGLEDDAEDDETEEEQSKIKVTSTIKRLADLIRTKSKLEEGLGYISTIEALETVDVYVSDLRDKEAPQLVKALGGELYVFDFKEESMYQVSDGGKKLIRSIGKSPLYRVALEEFTDKYAREKSIGYS